MDICGQHLYERTNDQKREDLDMTFEEAQRITAQALGVMELELYDPRLYLVPEVFGEFMFSALRIANPERKVEFTPPVTISGEFDNSCSPWIFCQSPSNWPAKA